MICPHCGNYFKKPGNYSESGKGHRSKVVIAVMAWEFKGEVTQRHMIKQFPNASKKELLNAANAAVKSERWVRIKRGVYTMKPQTPMSFEAAGIKGQQRKKEKRNASTNV